MKINWTLDIRECLSITENLTINESLSCMMELQWWVNYFNYFIFFFTLISSKWPYVSPPFSFNNIHSQSLGHSCTINRNYHNELLSEKDSTRLPAQSFGSPVWQSINIHLYFQYKKKTWQQCDSLPAQLEVT